MGQAVEPGTGDPGAGRRAPCPICGGTAFLAGPRGRAGPDGAPPRCAACGSLERHRAHRTVFSALGPAFAAHRRCLQFSPDPSVDPASFARHEVSVYGTAEGLDLQAIDRPDGSADAIVCNHVLEHVADDRAALRELARVLSPGGFLFLSVPDPIRMEATVEYGRAREDRHGHYRLYGPEVEALIAGAMAGFSALAVDARDPVSGAADRAFLIFRPPADPDEASRRLAAAGIAARRFA